jgi:hypothetical protein
LFWRIYSFWPKDCKQSFLDILKNPVPGVEFEGRIGEFDDFNTLWHHWFNQNTIAQWKERTKCLAQKQITKSIVPIVHDCPHLHIDSAAPQLHGYETYFIMYDKSMNKQVTEGEHSMPMTIYFATCHFPCPDIIFLELPRIPPNGFITWVLVNAIIAGIFGVGTCQTCIHIMKWGHVAEIKKKIRWQTVTLIEVEQNTSTNDDMLLLAKSSWNDRMHNIIKTMASAPQQMPSWARDFVTIMATTEISISNGRQSCVKLCWQISCIQVRFLREIRKVLHIFLIERTITSRKKLGKVNTT